MSKYNTTEKQSPFASGIKTSKLQIKAETNNKTNKLTDFSIVVIKRKKEQLKNFPIKKGKIKETFKEAEKYLENALKK